ncbi:MAG TPA: hypothetical protein PKE32_08265, partial [Miltoncostaeaceae bacterium]|nr:hypothetical protein [Miltoncostaeaceae bacterium]
MYADHETEAMRTAIGETNRRRAIQLAYNEEHGITPRTIVKGVTDIVELLGLKDDPNAAAKRRGHARPDHGDVSRDELERMIVEREQEMLAAAEDLRVLRPELGTQPR